MAIRTSPGEPFVIEIVGNPTTGYLWETDLPPGLELVEQQLEPDTTALGAAGKHRFTLRAARSGEYVLKVHLRRPWEPKGIETRSYTVVVEK